MQGDRTKEMSKLRSRNMIVSSSIVLAALLATSCQTAPSGQADGVRAQASAARSSEGECRLQVDPIRCKLEHDLAGGYPFNLIVR